MINKRYISSICCVMIFNTYMSAEVVELGQMSVTANKKEALNLSQDLSLVQKNKTEIQLDQVIYQKDLLNSLAGVRIEQTGSTIGHMTSIRMPQSTSGYYLFMQDGIPVQSSGFFNHNALAYTSFETSNDTEVLKGAGTALYGSDAVAATVNVKSSKLPTNNKDNNKVNIKVGSNSYLSTSIENKAKIDDKQSYTANINMTKSDGYREHTSYNRIESNIKYSNDINDENNLKFTFNFTKTNAQQADSFSDISYINSGSKKASDDSNYYLALEKTDVKRQFDYARLSLDWSNYKYDDLEIVVTPYIRYNQNQYIATWEDNLPSSNNKINTLGLMQKNTLDTSYGELIFGFDSEYTHSSLKYNQDFNLTIAGWGGATYTKEALYDYDVKYTAFAPYISNLWNINEKLKLTLGARYDYNKFDYTNNLSSSTDSSGKYFRPDSKIDTFNHVSPKASIGYAVDKNINLYFRYANGFKIPSATRLYSMKDGYIESTLNPEISNTYEIGFKRIFNKKAYFETNIYYMTLEDTILRGTNSSGDKYYYNSGENIHKGVELTLFNNITNEISSKIAYSYSKHNFKNDENYGNNNMKNAPTHTANVRLFYKPHNISKLIIMSEMQYVGSYWMDDANTKKYPGYKIYNIKSSFNYSKKISIFMKITNLTDEKYATSASSSWGDSYTPGSPREYYTGLEYKF